MADVIEPAKENNKGKLVYAQSKDQVVPQSFFKENIPVFILDAVIDNHFVQFIESKLDGVSFLSIDNAVKEFAASENTDEIVDADTTKTPSEMLPDIFKTALNNEHITFEAKPMDITGPAIIYDENDETIFTNESVYAKRNDGLPKLTCVLNSSSSLLKTIIGLNKSGKQRHFNQYANKWLILLYYPINSLKGHNWKPFTTVI